MGRATNAAAVDECEAPVEANEAIESNFAALRQGLAKVQDDLGAVIAWIQRTERNGSRNLEVVKPEDPLKAAVGRLETDVREQRADMKALHEKIDTVQTTLGTRIDSIRAEHREDYRSLSRSMADGHADLNRKIEAVDAKLSTQIGEVRDSMNEKIDSADARLGARIDSLDAKLTSRIDTVEEKLTSRIDVVEEKLTSRIDSVDSKLSGKLDQLASSVSDLRGLQKAILWVLGGVGSFATLAFTAARAFNWF